MANPKQIEPNDIVVFQEPVLNGEKVVYQNGAIAKVKRVSQGYDNELDLSYWLCEDENEREFKIINKIDEGKYKLLLDSKVKKAKNATNGYQKKLKWIEYYKLKEQYASIKFNYSSTIHKLQGSTYETVFIDIRKMQSLYKYSKNTDREFLYRLLYVAVTRASKDINILKNI
ncbi:helicase C-terminal domain-containing protein [Aliarcobacter cryaerophilus]|uniref:C-terminal helicase domain-containing protein n=1 Tax=Aliarcobacter cryaerophilus TaxID=28198 RepID=UPI003DA37EEF